ncbi:unnamed protein product [Symbiodinium sp. CCMP2592]|nr:unnamed protein product [Symbiodinium sp. CCMP2592]
MASWDGKRWDRGNSELTGSEGQDDSCWDWQADSWWDWQEGSGGGTWSGEDCTWKGQSRNDGYRSKNDEIREKARAPLLKTIKKLEEDLKQSRAENAALSLSLASVSTASSQAQSTSQQMMVAQTVGHHTDKELTRKLETSEDVASFEEQFRTFEELRSKLETSEEEAASVTASFRERSWMLSRTEAMAKQEVEEAERRWETELATARAQQEESERRWQTELATAGAQQKTQEDKWKSEIEVLVEDNGKRRALNSALSDEMTWRKNAEDQLRKELKAESVEELANT